MAKRSTLLLKLGTHSGVVRDGINLCVALELLIKAKLFETCLGRLDLTALQF